MRKAASRRRWRGQSELSPSGPSWLVPIPGIPTRGPWRSAGGVGRMTTSSVLGNLARGSGFRAAQSSTGKALGEGGVGWLVSTLGGEPGASAVLRTSDAAAERVPGCCGAWSPSEGRAGCPAGPAWSLSPTSTSTYLIRHRIRRAPSTAPAPQSDELSDTGATQ